MKKILITLFFIFLLAGGSVAIGMPQHKFSEHTFNSPGRNNDWGGHENGHEPFMKENNFHHDSDDYDVHHHDFEYHDRDFDHFRNRDFDHDYNNDFFFNGTNCHGEYWRYNSWWNSCNDNDHHDKYEDDHDHGDRDDKRNN
jgi:hypothetical protein